MSEKIQIFLNETLPQAYSNPPENSGELPVEDVDELQTLYTNRYSSFGEVEFHIYREKDLIPFIIAINKLFEAMGSETKVDARLLKSNIDQLTPMIVVNNEVISKGTYPDLTSLRGGGNSISRGGTGHHEH